MQDNWKMSALKASQEINPLMKFMQGRAVLVNKAGKVVRTISSSTCSVRLYWKCTSATGVLCGHVKFCTPSSLKHPRSLWCAFCSYDAALWQQQHMALLPHAEQQFIMNFLVRNGIDQQYCHQVTADFWKWPIDFWNHKFNFYVQIDGHCHWYGMHAVSKQVVQARDLSFNQLAYMAGARLVRVHHDDLTHNMVLLAAVNAATMGCSIVLTPKYARTQVMHNGQQMGYATVVQQMIPHAHIRSDVMGNILIAADEQLTLYLTS